MEENANNQKGEENKENTPETSTMPKRPKHILKENKKLDLLRSKSAPAEELNEMGENDDYIGSYNYFIYYNSMKCPDPRMPKPTYKAKPNLDYIKESKDKEEEDDEVQENVENLTHELNQLNLEQNENSTNNNQNIFNENFIENNQKNQSQKNKNSNFNETINEYIKSTK